MRFLFLPLNSHSGEMLALSFFFLLGLTSLRLTTSAEESQSRRSCFDTLAPVFLLPFLYIGLNKDSKLALTFILRPRSSPPLNGEEV